MGAPRHVRPLDQTNPVDRGGRVSTPRYGFCSSALVRRHPSGIVAQGYYEGGLRLIDVRDPRDIKEYGYVARALSEVWDAYWAPQRNKHGVATSGKTNIVYTVDAVRGSTSTQSTSRVRPATKRPFRSLDRAST